MCGQREGTASIHEMSALPTQLYPTSCFQIKTIYQMTMKTAAAMNLPFIINADVPTSTSCFPQIIVGLRILGRIRNPPIHCPIYTGSQGGRGAGRHPSWHWAQGEVHPGQVTSTSAGLTQPHTLAFIHPRVTMQTRGQHANSTEKDPDPGLEPRIFSLCGHNLLSTALPALK